MKSINFIKSFQKLLLICFRSGESEMIEMTYKVCVDKVKNLGVEFTPMKISLRDTIVSLKEKCLL